MVGLAMDPAREACGRPIHKLSGGHRRGRRHYCAHVLRERIAAVLETARHTLTSARDALDYRGVKLANRDGDLNHRVLLMIGLHRRDDQRVDAKHRTCARRESN